MYYKMQSFNLLGKSLSSKKEGCKYNFSRENENFLTLKLKKFSIFRKFHCIVHRTCLSVSMTHSIGLLASFGQSERILCVVCTLSTKQSVPKTFNCSHTVFVNRQEIFY